MILVDTTPLVALYYLTLLAIWLTHRRRARADTATDLLAKD